MIDFDIEDLEMLSNPRSFIRGRDYYESGCVKSIVKKGDFYEGIVRGSNSYKVTLDMSDDLPDFDCTCPYDFDGICKHAVAFGLAILDGCFEEKTANNLKLNQLTPDTFKACFDSADTKKKLDFLKQILDKDTDLQSQFYEYTMNAHETLDSISFVDVDEVKEQIRDALISIDFNDIIECYDPHYGDYYDDEGYADDALDAISDELSPFTDRAVDYFKKGNLTDGLKILSGMYEGIINLPDIDYCDFDIFGDSYEHKAFALLKDEFKRANDVLQSTVISEQQVKEGIDLLFIRYDYYKNREQEPEDKPFIYDLKVLEKFLIELITNQHTADYMLNGLVKNKLKDVPEMAFVMLKIAEIYDDEKLWIETAEKFAQHESTIARKLLDTYKTINDLINFKRIAELAFMKWPDTFSLYLVDNLDKESEKELYVKALMYYTNKSRSSEYYLILRTYLTEEERIAFVDKQKNGYDLKFYVDMLKIEKRYADILEIAKNENTYYTNYLYVLNPIVNIYPDECFEIIKKECNAAMSSPKRNRNTYERITDLLNVMLKIISKQNEALLYIKALYNYKPNLPALKDELRKRLGGKYFF